MSFLHEGRIISDPSLQALAALEAQEPPTYGPPANLVLDPNAPSPSSLIPGLAEPSPRTKPPPSFSPVPRYFYTGYATHGVPLVGNLLESFPFLPTWEDAESTNQLVVRQVENVFDPPPEPVKVVEVDRGSQQPEKVEVDLEQRRRLYEFRLETMIDYGSFDAPDVGRGSCLFTATNARLTHAPQAPFATLKSSDGCFISCRSTSTNLPSSRRKPSKTAR